MKKIRNQTMLICLFVIVGIALYFGIIRSQNSLLTTPTSSNIKSLPNPFPITGKSPIGSRIDDPVRNFINAYKTSIEFYGKVVDQHGDPVQGATVKVYPVNNAFGSSDTEFEITSDSNGLFSVNNMKALSIGVIVTKNGYLTLGDRGLEKPASSRSIDFGLSESKGNQFKDPTNPSLFTLHKVGAVEPLVYVTEKRWRLPVDGTPKKIALDSEKGVGVHQIEFRFKSGWNQLPNENESNFKRFDWSLQAQIVGGGFLKNKSDYNSEAPEVSYVETIKIEYPETLPREQWKRSRSERYFVKFADGTYGRIRFNIDGSSDTGPLSMTSWMNLKPGSRNLASLQKDNTDMPDE